MKNIAQSKNDIALAPQNYIVSPTLNFLVDVVKSSKQLVIARPRYR